MSRINSVDSEIFCDRLSSLMDSVGYGGRQRAKFASKIGVSSSFLSDVFNLKSGPSFKLISGIAKNFPYVSINWLLTGEGSLHIKEAAPSIGHVDLGLLGDTISVVEGWLEKNQRRLPPEKKAKVILYLYEEYLEKEEKPETATVERLLKLVA